MSHVEGVTQSGYRLLAYALPAFVAPCRQSLSIFTFRRFMAYNSVSVSRRQGMSYWPPGYLMQLPTRLSVYSVTDWNSWGYVASLGSPSAR